MDVLTRHKGSLTGVDDTTKHFAKSQSHDLSNNFKNSGATRDGPVFLNGSSC
jgi:hypothetical protein